MIAAAWILATAAAATPPAPGAVVEKLADATRTDLTFDGPVLGLTVLRKGESRGSILVLVGPPEKKKDASPCGTEPAIEEKPRREAKLFGWDPEHPETLVPLGRDLPLGTLDTADLDGDGTDEIVLYTESGIDELVVDGEAKTTTARELVAGALAPLPDEDGEDHELRAVSFGSMTTYRRGTAQALRPVSDVELPIRVERRAESVRVRTLSVHPVARGTDGRVRFAGALERIPDQRRLRLVLLDPDGPKDAVSIEAWARFPGRERALEHTVALLDGVPVLVVLTTTADKLSLFGEKKLRIFPLAPDRTRSGVAPLFADETGINLWQGTSPEILDLDKDGHEDLVLVYWKGLKDTIAALEVRRRNADGTFARAKTLTFDVTDGDRGSTFYGRDLDGDGRPDLALRAAGTLLVYPGSPPAEAIDRPVGKVPSRRIPLPSGWAAVVDETMSFGPEGLSVDRNVADPRLPRFADLDGDGRAEAIFTGGSGTAGRVAIVRFR